MTKSTKRKRVPLTSEQKAKYNEARREKREKERENQSPWWKKTKAKERAYRSSVMERAILKEPLA